MGFTITIWLPLFVTATILVHAPGNLAQREISKAAIFFTPPPMGKPPVYELDKTATYRSKVVISCDGRMNQNGTVDVILRVKKKNKVLTTDFLTNRRGLKTMATQKGFAGKLTGRILNYTMTNITCAQDGIVFECTVGAVPNKELVTVSKTLALSVVDSVARVSPPSDPTALRSVGDFISITCFAAVAIHSADKGESKNPIEWQWQQKDKGEVRFKDISSEKKQLVDDYPLQKGVCRGGNTTTKLSVTLQKEDSHRTYRCVYKNKDAANKDFQYDQAAKFEIGLVSDREKPLDDVKAEVTYTKSSLVGMILGLTSFVSISCLGVFYTYRKNRGGKKYNIVKTLLEQEEEELDKIEATLGMAAGQGGVETNAEESSANESSVAESDVSSQAPATSTAPSTADATSTAG